MPRGAWTVNRYVRYKAWLFGREILLESVNNNDKVMNWFKQRISILLYYSPRRSMMEVGRCRVRTSDDVGYSKLHASNCNLIGLCGICCMEEWN